MPGDKQQPGEAQEEHVRQRLVAEGYEQPYGISDREISRRLGVVGKCADFVGYNPKEGKWLIAESKGNDLWSAELQIANTLVALLSKQPEATGNVELQVYTNQLQYSRLTQDPRGVGGYYRQEDFLGFMPDGKTFQFAEILGYKVRILEGNEE